MDDISSVKIRLDEVLYDVHERYIALENSYDLFSRSLYRQGQ
jgi:hypothetical protein